MAPDKLVLLWYHWNWRGVLPEAEQDSMTELLNSTVFAVSPEAVMCTFEGTAARKVNSANADHASSKAISIDQETLHIL